MAGNLKKKVKDIRKGDVVISPAVNGEQTKVICVIKTPCLNNEAFLVEFGNGLIITPYHPIRINTIWRFPCELQECTLKTCDFVYSFILEQGHSMEINGYECVTYAHHFEDSQVVKHPYFGTNKIIEDLKQMEGWEEGHVLLTNNPLVRHPNTHLVIGQ